MKGLDPVYRGLCPNCGGPIRAERLEKGLPCASCYPWEAPASVEEIAKRLAERGRLRGYLWLYDLESRYSDFKVYFEARTGSSLWSAQRSWARRLLALESLAIIAPTGVGKTTLLMVYAAYRVERDGWRILYLVPTENLARQVASRLEELLGGRVAYYYSSLPKARKEEMISRIESGDYSVLVATTSFLQRRFDLLQGGRFDLVIVDDVDSLLRNSRNVDRVLGLLGFPGEALEAAERLVKARIRLYAALAAGRKDLVEKYEAEVAEAEESLQIALPSDAGQLVIASATGRPRGLKHLLFKELLGFEVGGGTDYMRDVTDAYTLTGKPFERAADIVERLGPGGVVFVSQVHGKAAAKALKAVLEARGLRVALALAGSRRAVDKLARGEVDVVVGVASRYGVLVRGVDLPERIRYAVFLGVPARRMDFDDAVASPRRLLSILVYLSDKGDTAARAYVEKIRRLLDKISDTSVVSLAYKGRIKPEGLLAELVNVMREASEYAKARMLEEASGGPVRIRGIVVEREDDDLKIFMPDAATYLQASGRTSRLYKGVMTHGLSVIVEETRERVEALEERLRLYTSTSIVDYDSLDLDAEMRRISETRRGKGKRVSVKTVLLVVESPTKARTIAWFWGRPSKRRSGRLVVYETSTGDPETGTIYLLTITATRGHLFDLALDEDGSVFGVHVAGGSYSPVYTTVKRCLDCGYQYAAEGPCPRCGSQRVLDSQSVVNTLRKLASEVDEVIIATDPDREGEKIAWDVYLAVRPYNPRVRRGAFHEVTREAVLAALRSAGSVDDRLVAAQIVRRIEDRWIGFSLSQHLWSVYGKRWLGAGRVQTPVLGWVVERYQEWKGERGYYVILRVRGGGRVYIYTREKPAETPSYMSVVEAEYWEEEAGPQPPFTTDSLIYEAGRRLGLPAGLTMKLAQELFESGLITYHRTDSTRVSPAGLAVAASYLESRGLKHLYTPRTWGEGGAHEAIRPTRPIDAEELEKRILDGSIRVPVKLTRLHLKLYKLIFDRFIASQSRKSKFVKARIVVEYAGLREELDLVVDAVGEGFHLFYGPRIDAWARNLSPGARIPVEEAKLVRGSRVRLYTSADLVRLMKERGIGRPSTYAKAIEANKRHGYVVESKRRGYMIPTKTGIEVYKYLSSNFDDLVSEETSRRLEELLDAVESGRLEAWEALERVRSLVESSLSSVIEGYTLAGAKEAA